MIEAPEALILARQLGETIRGRRITEVVAGFTPHKFAWFSGSPEQYPAMLLGLTIGQTHAWGGYVEIEAGAMRLLFGDGVNLRWYAPGATLPPKHQLLIGFDDESCLVASVRMYGAMMCYPEGKADGPFAPYMETARRKPQVMSEAFTREYFRSLTDAPQEQKKSAKAFLATLQSIPGLGNGVLQDILYQAGLHPKAKVTALSSGRRDALYAAVRVTLDEMLGKGGRSTETDLFGRPGGYVPFLSAATAGCGCVRCGETIVKESYLGGSVYYCPGCQKMK